jgi:hypothetical protein
MELLHNLSLVGRPDSHDQQWVSKYTRHAPSLFNSGLVPFFPSLPLDITS